jgi:hypothetical protein
MTNPWARKKFGTRNEFVAMGSSEWTGANVKREAMCVMEYFDELDTLPAAQGRNRSHER